MGLDLAGRIIVVVGGYGLIGSATVERLNDEGAIALPASRRPEAALRIDGGDDHSTAAAVAAVLERHGRIDGVVVAAAPSARTLDPAYNADPVQVLSAFDAKTIAFLRLANAFLPVMTNAGYGRVVGVSGQNAFITGNITGTLRNAGLILVAKSLADSVAGSGVTVNTVSPGIVQREPDMGVEAGKPGDSTPADVANALAFLLSPLSGAISGESIAVGHRVRGVTSM